MSPVINSCSWFMQYFTQFARRPLHIDIGCARGRCVSQLAVKYLLSLHYALVLILSFIGRFEMERMN